MVKVSIPIVMKNQETMQNKSFDCTFISNQFSVHGIEIRLRIRILVSDKKSQFRFVNT